MKLGVALLREKTTGNVASLDTRIPQQNPEDALCRTRFDEHTVVYLLGIGCPGTGGGAAAIASKK